MQAGKFNILINKKANLKVPLTLYSVYDEKTKTGTPVNLTGATVSAKAKVKITDPSPVVTFTCTVTDATAGKIEVSLSAAQTTSLSFEKGVYDLFVTDNSGFVTKYLEGNVIVSKNVS